MGFQPVHVVWDQAGLWGHDTVWRASQSLLCIFRTSFVCFACWGLDLWFVGVLLSAVGLLGLVVHTSRSSWPCHVVSRGVRPSWFCKFVLLAFLVRVGEASHPGPSSSGSSWSMGIFNPSGLRSKIDALAHLPGNVWMGSETHLTSDGFRKLKRGLRSLGSSYRYAIPGAFCTERTAAGAGVHQGVISVSTFPARSLPHAIPSDMYQTARLQVVGFAVGSFWIQAGVLYGLPDSPQYCTRTYQTNAMLEQLIWRIGFQADGPRVICGDLNHNEDQLECLGQLKALGFQEIQAIARDRWGHIPIPTGRGSMQIDQMWLSPELQALMIDFDTCPDHWPDHTSLVGVFQRDPSPLFSYRWYLPQSFPWPNDFECPIQGCDWESQPSLAYASLWYQVEQHATDRLEVGKKRSGFLGRGQTLNTSPCYESTAPCKIGRQNTVESTYFGASLCHARWFRQLRRLQALARMQQSSSCNAQHRLKFVELWRAVRYACGFPGGFLLWWSWKFPDSEELTCVVPSGVVVQAMYDAFLTVFRQYEKELIGRRCRTAKQTRVDKPNLVFQDCARDQPDPVDTLVQSVECEVESVCHDDSSVVLVSPVVVDSSLPLVFQGKPREIIYAEADQIWLNDVKDLVPGQIGRQQQVYTSDHDIIQQFSRTWQPRWQKLHQVVPGQWQQIIDFCTATFRPIPWNFEPISPAQFKTAAHAKKLKSAVGPDGVSRQDLISIPDQAHAELCHMIQAVEQGGTWPTQIVQGFVKCLSKGKGDAHVDGFRPIVVYSIVIRTWSSLRARVALSSLSRYLPRSVRGGIPHCQAKTVWYHIAQLIEFAHLNSSSLQGLAIDIRRAFNALPREPLWHLLLCLGFPAHILHAWKAFVVQQQRRFCVRRSTSAPHWSCTGFPEGCAFSVFAMALVDYLVDAWLTAMVPSLHSLHMYVDDWHFLASSPEVLLEVWHRLLEFAGLMELEVDAAKSFMWAAQAHDRKALQHGPVPVLLASKALGARHNFCRRKGNREVVQRIGALVSLWPRLRASMSPVWVKARILKQLAWPRAFYSVSVVHLGDTHFSHLRTGALRALGANRIGASPSLHLSTWQLWSDPEAWCILQTFREAREVGNLAALRMMLQLTSSLGGSVPQNGPASVIHDRAVRLGWTLTPAGTFLDEFGEFDLLTVAWDLLVAKVKWAWPQVLGTEHCHRRSFEGLHLTWLEEVPKSLARFSTQDQIYLRCAMDGTLYHDISKDKSNRGKHSKCQFCNGVDSFFHRVWECPYFHTCRESFPWISLVSELPQAVSCHGWPLRPVAWVGLQRYFNQIVVPEVRVVWSRHALTEVQDLFVDGTCAWPAEPSLRYSAWAITLASRTAGVLDHQVIGAGHTVGQLQSAFRAELEALVTAFEIVVVSGIRARIWSDCQSVLRGVDRLFQGFPIKPNKSHADLWYRLESLISKLAPGQIHLFKVVSHASCANADNGLEEWAFWHNRLVDEAAAAHNKQRPETFWVQWQKVHDSVFAHRHLLREIHGVLLRVAYKARVPTDGNGGAVEISPVFPPADVDDAEAPLHKSWLRRCWQFSSKLERKYRRENIEAVHQWWQRHGVPALQTRAPLRWISGLQLFLDFYCSTGFRGCISPKHGVWFVSPNEDASGLPSFGKHSTMFLRIWNAYCKENQVVISHQITKPAGAALTYWTMCWRLPWSNVRINELDDIILQQFGHQLTRPGQANRLSFAPVERTALMECTA